MKTHIVRARAAAADFARTEHLATRIAEVAADPVEVTAEVSAMIVNRIIDIAAVASAALVRRPVTNARAQALAQPHAPRPDRSGANILIRPLSEYAQRELLVAG